MKTIVATLFTLVLLMLVGPAQASYVSQPKGSELYQVFNALFYETGDPLRMVNNTALLVKSGHYLADGSDLVFGDPGDTLRVDLTFRESGWGGELGLWNGINDTADSGYETLIQKDNIPSHTFAEQWATFTWKEGSTFADTDIEKGRAQNRWSANSDLNLMGEDHFVAFAIEDDALLDVYNRQFGTSYSAALDDVWLIGFEEHSWDADFNDLMAVVSRPAELNSAPLPTPVPGAVWLLGSGLVGLAGLKRRKG